VSKGLARPGPAACRAVPGTPGRAAVEIRRFDHDSRL